MLLSLLAKLALTEPPATTDEIADAESALGPLPPDLKAFLVHANGYDGFPHPDNYLAIYSTTEIVEANRAYEVRETRPELLLFATDRAGEGFFFDMSRSGPPVLYIAFISDWHDDAFACGDTFTDFLGRQIAGRSPP